MGSPSALLCRGKDTAGCPVALNTGVKGTRAAALVPFTPVFNATGQPAVSLPLHHSAAGLPIGVQLVAPYGREDVLIRVAAQLEQAAPWDERRPPVSA